MKMPLHIPAKEVGAIRVFAVNRPAGDMDHALQSRPMPDVARDLLNAPHLNTKSAEIFAVSDLTELGLAGYLHDGYAVDSAQIDPDRARLSAIEGYVLLLFSDSFGGAEMTLDAGPDVTLIGTYAEARADQSARPIAAESAKPFTGTGGLTPPVAPRGPAGSAMVVIGLITGLVLLIWWLLD
ncbi:MAG: hypothetical protein WBC93_22120 [Sulfitobacter sp.]